MTHNTTEKDIKVLKTANATENEEALKAAMALNLCTTSISKIISAQDINIMRHEYDYILNNINLEKIIKDKDEALLSTMKSILDTLSFYLIQQKDREMIAQRYQHKMNNAIWDSVMGIPTSIVLAVSPNPISAAISAAVSGAISIGSAYVNYRRSKSNTDLERIEEEWKLERAALEQLHALRLSLFETAWRLFASYDIADELRLSVKQVDLYNGLLMEPNPKWRYQKLEMVKDYFNAYPYFWYELSEAAYQVYNSYVKKQQEYYQKNKDSIKAENSEILTECWESAFADQRKSYLQKADKAIDKFFEIIKGRELLRQDVIYASAIVRKIQILHEGGNSWNKSVKGIAESLGKHIEDLEKFYSKLAADSPDLLMNAAMIFLAAYNDNEEDENRKKNADSSKRLFWMLVNQGYNVPMTTRMLSWLDLATGDTEDYELLKELVGGPREQADEIKILRIKRDNSSSRITRAEKGSMILTKDNYMNFLNIEERREDTIAELKQISGTMFDIALKKACPIFNEQYNAIIALSNYFKNNDIVSAKRAQKEVTKYLDPIYAELNAQCLVWQDTWDIDFLTMRNAIKRIKNKVDLVGDKVGSYETSSYMQAEAICKMIAVFRSYFTYSLVFKALLNERRSSKESEEEQEDLLTQNIKYFNDRIYNLRSKISQFQDNYFISNMTIPTTLMDYSINYFSGEQETTSVAWAFNTKEKEKKLMGFIESHDDIIVDGISFRKNEKNEQLCDLLEAMKQKNLTVLVYNLGAPIPPAAIQENAYPFWTSISYIWNYVFNCRNTRTFRRQYNHADYRIALYPSKIVAHYNKDKKRKKD